MATDSKPTGTGTTPDMSEIGNQLATNLASADSIAAQRVQSLASIHQARAAQLSRTAASLKAQYGANDPGVKSAEAAVAAARGTAASVAVVHQQVTTTEPAVAPKGWALHGRVFDAQLAPVSGFTVFLVDVAKAYLQAYGFAYTDDSGYFLLNYPGSTGASGGRSATASQAANATGLFVEIANRKTRPVYLSATAFQPVLGNATYQNIVLPAGNNSIGDPPAEIRQVAVPKPKVGSRQRKGNI
jgi:hypothetical protein